MRRRLLVAIVVVGLSAVACGSSGDAGIATRLDEYEIDLATGSAPVGEQTFAVRNVGEVAHQVVVLRTEHAAGDLPVSDGIVRLDAKGIDEVGGIELLASDAAQDLTVDLEPGRYVLICNIAGHYASGMHAPFRAR